MQVISHTDQDGPERLLNIEAYDESYITWLTDISRQIQNSRQNILKHESDLIKKKRKWQRRIDKIERQLSKAGVFRSLRSSMPETAGQPDFSARNVSN